MHAASKGPGKKARIEIIPLIDIMFFLLASFMLVSLSMIRLQAIPTNLPSKSTTPPASKDKPDFVVIGIDADSKVYYDQDKDPIDPDKIPARLQDLYKEKQKDSKVFINSDSAAKYNMVITILDKVRSVGIEKVSFPVKPDNHFDPTKPRPASPLGGPAAAAAPAAPAATNP